MFAVFGLAASACSGTAESEPSFSPPTAAPTQKAGVVKLNPKSRAYVVTQKLELATSTPIVRSPARVAFKDGAMSEVDTPMPGRIIDVKVAVGDRVKKDQVLVTLTSPDAAAARAALTGAVAGMDAAQQEATRQDHMAQTGVGVESDRVAAQSRLRQAQAELERARSAVALLGGGGGSTIIVTAPIDGTVIARHATVGQVAQPGGESMFQIGNPTSLWVVAEVFERDLRSVHEGADVDIDLSTRAQPVHGVVQSIGSAMTGSLRTAPVYITLTDTVDGVRAGMFARAAIRAPAGETMVLPAEAVLIKDGKTFLVYVKTGEDLYTAHPVEIGASIGGKVEIRSGLQPGDDVVIKGALLLDGAAEQLL